MTTGPREIPFQVDMAGIIEILGFSLYSRRDTAIRELLQNAHDAIVRRRAKELSFLGEIRIKQDPEAKTLTITDNGLGLSLEEAETYLGTLGIGLSGLLKRQSQAGRGQDRTGIIGQFGVGLFSSFLLAESVVLESRKSHDEPAVRWQAGIGASIRLQEAERPELGTSVCLKLGSENLAWASDAQLIKDAVRYYADFLPIPVFLGDKKRRLNVMTPSWFEATPDPEMVSMELEQRFDDMPLDLLLINQETPAIRGAVFITRERTPGFSGRPLVTATVRRMVISPRLDGLFPEWGSFYRGILEFSDLQPTTSREDLIRNDAFDEIKAELEAILFSRLQDLSVNDRVKFQAILSWHRYSLAGAALQHSQLRALLRHNYLFSTSQGALTFDDILQRTLADEDSILATLPAPWFNTDRKQEAWLNNVFEGLSKPCVQCLRTFEYTLLALMWADFQKTHENFKDVSPQIAAPSNEEFLSQILGIDDKQALTDEWREYFSVFDVEVSQARFRGAIPVLAFPDRSLELEREFQSLKKQGQIPSAFSRMIDRYYLDKDESKRGQVILNSKHRIVKNALAGTKHSPLASVLRLLIHNALLTAGASTPANVHETINKDLDWIAEAMMPRRQDSDHPKDAETS